MDDPHNWITSTRQKFLRYLNGEKSCSKFIRNSSNISHKLPPRLQKNGLSVAVRVFGHEIRNFTKYYTGKDLADLRHSDTRKLLLTKLAAFKVAISSTENQYELLSLLYSHSSSLATSLSPEDSEFDNSSIKNNVMKDIVSKYHKDCIENYKDANITSRKRKLERFPEDRYNKQKEITPFTIVTENCQCGLFDRDEELGDFKFQNCWKHKGITEEELDRFCDENIEHFHQANILQLNVADSSEWSHFMKTNDAVVFRRKLKNGLYEYRVQATYFDISANNLFQTQIDGGYRKQWDEYVVDLNVVDSNKPTSSELIHWVTKCPSPFSTREYIYLRRQKIDEEKKAMILYSKATTETNIPRKDKIERVETYVSKLIIKPHTSFNKDGCDFLLMYYDDPKIMLPRSVLDMAASRGIANSLSKMHEAAFGLTEMSKKDAEVATSM